MMNAAEAIKQMWTLADKPERMRCFHKIVFELGLDDNKAFWSEFWSIWQTSENLNDDEDYIRELVEYGLTLGDPRAGIADDEGKALDAMPDLLTVYRGGIEVNQHGWSWATDREKAKWFAGRAVGSTTRILLRGTVAKEHVLAYLMGRNEFEIVVDPDHVDYEVDEEWEAENEGHGLFYAIQSGRFNLGNDELDKARAQMMVSGFKGDIDATLASMEKSLAFVKWADLRQKLGYLEAVIDLLKQKKADPAFDPLPGFAI